MEMEQEIDSLFENITERRTLYHNTIPTYIYLFRYFQIVICLLGFLLNSLIVIIVLRSKHMRTRTNLIFMNRCIYDSLYLASDCIYFIVYLILGEAIYDHDIVYCFQRHTMGLFEMTMWGFTLMLLSNKLMNTKDLTTRTLLTFGNLTVLVYFTAQVIQCVHECKSRHVIEGVVAFTLGILLLLVTLTKDINRCRRNSNIPISKDCKFRLNIARILTYNWTVCFFFNLFSLHHIFYTFFELCMSLNAVYTFVYVFCSDKSYKARVLKVLNFDFDFDKENSFVENCLYAKTTRKDQSIVIDFKSMDDDVVDDA